MIGKLATWLAGPGLAWLAGFFEDGTTGSRSAKRLVLILGGVSMSSAVVILARKAAPGHDVAGALWAVTTPLAAMGGAGYIAGKYVESKKQSQAQGTPDPPQGGGQ